MKISLTLLCCLAFSCALQSQTISRRSVDIPKLQAVPQLDGRLLDTVWNQSARTGDFTTSTPVFGRTPAGATEVYLFYTDEALYVAAVCKSTLVRSDGSVRDDLNSGDWFRVGLDTWNDDQNAFQFAVNAAGVQSDGRSSSNFYDLEYDTRWQSAVSITADGWALEMRIPYTALRFPPGAGEQTWGLQFTRFDRGSAELSTWSPQDPNVGDGVWQYGELTGIRAIRQGFRRSAQLYNTADFRSGDFPEYASLQYGADVRLGWQSNTTLDLTLFPTTTSQWGSSFFFNSQDEYMTKIGGDAPYPRQFDAEEGGLWAKTGLPEGEPNVISGSLAGKNIPAGAFLLFPYGGEPLQSLRFNTRTKQNTGISVFNAVMSPVRGGYVLNGIPTFDTLLQKVSNYNVLIAEQALANNAWVSLSNANVQAGPGVHYNRTTLNTQLRNRANTLQFAAEQSMSRQGYGDDESPRNGWRYRYGLSRINRRFGWFANHSGTSKGYSFSYLEYQRPNTPNAFANSLAGLSWTDFRPKGPFQNYRATLSSDYIWGNNYSKGRWGGLTLQSAALDRRFQTWGLYLNLLQEGSSQIYVLNNNIIVRDISSRSTISFSYQTDQRRRFTLTTAIGGTVYNQQENNGMFLEFRPRWVLHPKLILGAYSYVSQSYNNLRVLEAIQGEWAFEQYQGRELRTGLTFDYFLTKRWWVGLQAGWQDEWRPQREAVVLKANKSLQPLPNYSLEEFKMQDAIDLRASLQWQLRHIDYLRFSYVFDQRPVFNSLGTPSFPGTDPRHNTQLQLQMIFFLDGSR